jgi:hypothetical protein
LRGLVEDGAVNDQQSAPGRAFVSRDEIPLGREVVEQGCLFDEIAGAGRR